LFSRLAGRSIMLSSSVPSTEMAAQDPITQDPTTNTFTTNTLTKDTVTTDTVTTNTVTTATKKRFEKLGRHGIRVGIVGGPGLEHGSREVDALAELYGDPLVLQGSEATVDAMCDLLNSADVVHVAAHGHRRVDNALFSGIELYDGPLMAYDIERLSRTPETVILSCCDLGAANSGAFGLLGFSGAMVSRGTRQVAGAVLPVSDEMSRLIMVRLHTSMMQGMSVSEALAHGVTTAGSLLERVTAGAYVVKGP
jgi:CHAT domain-containing protein